MPIIEEVTSRNQQPMGRFKARADQSKFGSVFAVAEGDTDGRWEHVRDITTVGQQIGRGQSGRLVYTEFKDENGKTNDISYNGLKLREVIAPIAEVREKARREAMLSTTDCKDFLTAENLQNRVQLDGNLSLRASLETTHGSIDQEAEPLPAGEPIKRGPGRPPKAS